MERKDVRLRCGTVLCSLLGILEGNWSANWYSIFSEFNFVWSCNGWSVQYMYLVPADTIVLSSRVYSNEWRKSREDFRIRLTEPQKRKGRRCGGCGAPRFRFISNLSTGWGRGWEYADV